MFDEPAIPAANGTFSFTADARGAYTIGREPVLDALPRMVAGTATVAVDIETFGLGVDALRLKCVTIADELHAVVADPRDEAQADAIRAALIAAGTLVLHNSSFDVPLLVRTGLLRMADVGKVVDTLLYARLASPDERTAKNLNRCAERYLDTRGGDELRVAFTMLGLTVREGFYRFDIDRPLYVMGAASDALTTARLLAPVRATAFSQLTEGHPYGRGGGVTGDEALALLDREQRVNRMLLRGAARGLAVDFEFLDEYRQATQRRRDQAEQTLTDIGIRPGVGADLCAWLERDGSLPSTHPRTAKTGAPSSRAAHLEALAHPMARTFVEHKRIAKIADDYLAKVTNLADASNRIHPTTALLAATTGRASMADPPLQQFPDAARGIVLADEGDALTSLDWKQIEPIVAANFAGDTELVQFYEDGGRVYDGVAARAGIGDKQAKTVLLGVLYGEGVGKLAGDLDVTVEEASELRESVFRAMPKVRKLERNLRALGERNRLIFTLSGRMVPVPMGRGFDGGPPSVATHKAVNYFVQGSAYDVLAEALVRIEDAGLGDAVYLTVHDEIVCSTAAADDIAAIMETPPERLCAAVGRTPKLRLDRHDMGRRWAAV